MALKVKALTEARKDIPLHEVTREDIVHVNVLAPAKMRQEWKVAGAQLNMTVSDMVKAAMADYLAKRLNDQMVK